MIFVISSVLIISIFLLLLFLGLKCNNDLIKVICWIILLFWVIQCHRQCEKDKEEEAIRKYKMEKAVEEIRKDKERAYRILNGEE